MEFRNQLDAREIILHNLGQNPEIEWFWVTVNEDDMRKRIHRYVRAQPNDSPWDWHKITPETCLKKFAHFLVNNNFKCQDEYLQCHIDQIKLISDNFDITRANNPIWQYISHSREGPFMIWNGVHRQTAMFIHYFINNNSKFEPVQFAVCGLSASMEGDLGRIPDNFCD